MARTAEEILNLANKATNSLVGRYQGWTMEDWADMRQEAAVAICTLNDDTREDWCVRAAQTAIYDWMRMWLRAPRAGVVLDWVDYAVSPERPWPLTYLDALVPLLAAQRAQKIDEDMAYLQLRLRGYSTAGVALELGISERNVYAIRERLIPRLERIARGEEPPPRTVNLHVNSRAALERINSDPAMLARRGEAIRAGLARRKERAAARG